MILNSRLVRYRFRNCIRWFSIPKAITIATPRVGVHPPNEFGVGTIHESSGEGTVKSTSDVVLCVERQSPDWLLLDINVVWLRF